MDIQATPVFEKVRDTTKKSWKILILRGGTRSSKTYSMMQLILIRLLTGKFGEIDQPKGVTHICRKFKSTLRISVMRDFEEIIADWGVGGKIDFNRSERTFKVGERLVEFIGADDQQKLRGSKRDFLYCNEANELAYKQEFFQLLIRTKVKVIIDFNPSDEDVRINTELEQKRKQQNKDVEVIVSTYKDNPFLTSEEVAEIENIQNIDKYLREVYGKGQYGKVQGLIFNNRDVIDELPQEAEYIVHGMDFGFTNDPTACIGIYRWNSCIVLDEELYEAGLTNPDIDKKLVNAGVVKAKAEIIADSAEPKSIQELHNMGWTIRPATKGPDSVIYGIQVMQSYKILITGRSFNLLKEFKKYKRKDDRIGNATNQPIDEFNHGIDASRYGIVEKLAMQTKIVALFV